MHKNETSLSSLHVSSRLTNMDHGISLGIVAIGLVTCAELNDRSEQGAITTPFLSFVLTLIRSPNRSSAQVYTSVSANAYPAVVCHEPSRPLAHL